MPRRVSDTGTLAEHGCAMGTCFMVARSATHKTWCLLLEYLFKTRGYVMEAGEITIHIED